MKRALPTLFRSKKQRRYAKSMSRCRTFEALEDRHMMAVAPVTTTPIFQPSVNAPAAALMAGVSNGTLYIRGTDAADNINLRQVNDAITIDGLSGSFNTNDFQNITIRSFGGNDTINLKSEAIKGQQAITKATKIWSGAGADQVTGGRGNDTIFAEADNDKVWGNYGDDIIDGGAGDDQLHGEFGADKIFGDLGTDTLWGDDGADILIGGNDSDYLYGGRGVDHLDGSLGYDYLYGQDDFDYLNDDSGLKSDSGSNQISSTSSIVLSWFDRNLQDASVRTEARFDYATDYTINRTEMMSVFDAAEDGYTIEANELADLQHLVGNVDVSMSYYVRDLAGSIVNYDAANFYYQGSSLGNLAAGDSSAKLEKLVDKWFLGVDHPVAQSPDANGVMQNLTYQFVQGSLFQNGISYTDISQGMLGDCYFLAALGAVARQNPSIIQSMFVDNGDNTFSVGFHHDGKLHYVTVDRYLPVFGGGDDSAVYAQFGADKDDPNNELWVALAEKAYAEVNESGWLGHFAANSYHAIDAGQAAVAMVHLTGWDVHYASMYSASDPKTTTFTSDEIVSKVNSGKALVVDSALSPVNSTVVPDHAYTVVGYDATTGKFKLFNPHGLRGSDGGFLYLSWNEIVANFINWDYT